MMTSVSRPRLARPPAGPGLAAQSCRTPGALVVTTYIYVNVSFILNKRVRGKGIYVKPLDG